MSQFISGTRLCLSDEAGGSADGEAESLTRPEPGSERGHSESPPVQTQPFLTSFSILLYFFLIIRRCFRSMLRSCRPRSLNHCLVSCNFIGAFFIYRCNSQCNSVKGKVGVKGNREHLLQPFLFSSGAHERSTFVVSASSAFRHQRLESFSQDSAILLSILCDGSYLFISAPKTASTRLNVFILKVPYCATCPVCL